MRKIFSLIVVLIMLMSTVLCFSCGKKNNNEEGNIDLNLPYDYSCKISFAYSDDPSEKVLIDNIIKGFNKIYPNISVKSVPISSYESQIISDFGAGMYYDVFWVADSTVASFSEEDMLLNLDPYIEASGVDLSLYFDSMIKLCRKNHTDNMIMLPRDYSNCVTYINKDLFEQAEVEVPTNMDWTWEDFVQICSKLKSGWADNGVTGKYALDADFDWTILFWSMLKSFGDNNSKMITEDGYSDWGNSSSKGNSYDAAYTTYSQIKTLVDNGYVCKPSLNQTGLFQTTKAAMWFMSRPKLGTLQSVPINLAVLPFPAIGQNPHSGAGTTGYAISKASRNKVAAWKLLEYIISEDGQKQLSTTGGVVPVLKSLAEDTNADWRKFKDYYGNTFNHSAFIHNAEGTVIPDYFQNIPASQLLAYNGTFVSSIKNVMNGENTIEDGIAIYTANIKKLVSNWK